MSDRTTMQCDGCLRSAETARDLLILLGIRLCPECVIDPPVECLFCDRPVYGSGDVCPRCAGQQPPLTI